MQLKSLSDSCLFNKQLQQCTEGGFCPTTRVLDGNPKLWHAPVNLACLPDHVIGCLSDQETQSSELAAYVSVNLTGAMWQYCDFTEFGVVGGHVVNETHTPCLKIFIWTAW